MIYEKTIAEAVEALAEKQRREAERGSWRTMRKKKSGFITLLGFGPIHLDETIGLGNVESVTYFFPDIGKFCL